jgi:hypothetical protein
MAGPLAIEVGPAAGVLWYRAPESRSAPVAGLDLLLRRKALGLHATEEYANFSGLGTFTATHIDVVYSHPIGRIRVLVGGGPSFVSVTNLESATTWNLEGEISRRWQRADVFARVRYCRFTVNGFRVQASARGPAVSAGVRFVISE